MLDPNNTALVLIDVQGSLAKNMPERELLFNNLIRNIKAAQLLAIPVIWLEQYPEGLGETIPELATLLNDQSPLRKTTFGCLSTPEIADIIDNLGCNQLVVCGIEAHICVYQSVIQLLNAGYQVELITDAIASRNPSNKTLAIEKMESKGVALTSTEMWIFEVTQDARSPLFKEILNIIK